jgi:hypothetical protein
VNAITVRIPVQVLEDRVRIEMSREEAIGLRHLMTTLLVPFTTPDAAVYDGARKELVHLLNTVL